MSGESTLSEQTNECLTHAFSSFGYTSVGSDIHDTSLRFNEVIYLLVTRSFPQKASRRDLTFLSKSVAS